jgi:hypothetical protein
MRNACTNLDECCGRRHRFESQQIESRSICNSRAKMNVSMQLDAVVVPGVERQVTAAVLPGRSFLHASVFFV